MILSELKDAIKKESIIDETNLDKESIKIPYIHSKWYNNLVEESLKLSKIQTEYKKLLKQKQLYYLGKAPDDEYKKNPLDYKVIKQDLDLYLETDDELIVLNTKLLEQKLMCDLIENFIKSINQRSFNIRNAISFLNFKNGINE